MPKAETYDDHIVRLLLVAAAVWGIVGMAIGVLAAAQLTEPELVLDDVRTMGALSCEAALTLAASLGRESRHPVARAIVAARSNHAINSATDVGSHGGLVISGIVANRELRLGQPPFALRNGLQSCWPDDAVLLC